MSLAWVALAGMGGAVARYLLDTWLTSRTHGPFRWGTFIVNTTGSFALGLLAGLATAGWVSPEVRVAVGVGFLGAYTTFSTWMYETARLLEQRNWTVAALNVVGHLLAGTVAAGLGWWLALQA
jgi:CrcB protein